MSRHNPFARPTARHDGPSTAAASTSSSGTTAYPQAEQDPVPIPTPFVHSTSVSADGFQTSTRNPFAKTISARDLRRTLEGASREPNASCVKETALLDNSNVQRNPHGSLQDEETHLRLNVTPKPASGTPICFEHGGRIDVETTSIPVMNTSHPEQLPTTTNAPTIPTATSTSISRWRLLWRGGLEVGKDRYKLDGIAFCAQMRFGIPLSVGRGGVATPTGKGDFGGDEGTPSVGSVQTMLGKEVAMREEGSYFSSNALDVGTSLPGSNHLDSSTTTAGKTPRARRPLLKTQSSTLDSSSVFTPGGSLTAKAFETSDPDLCLSLESMKGRQTLRVAGVERLSEEDLLEDGQGGDGVHVYLDQASNQSSSLSGKAHSVLAQYIFNSICRGRLSPSGRTRKALVVTLGDDVIDAPASATFLIYGQLKQDTPASGVGRPKLELLATRRKAPPKHEGANQNPGLRPGEPLPRGKSSIRTFQDIPLTCLSSSDALYTEDGFKVPTMLSSRSLRRSASVATQAARMSRVRSQSTIYMPPPQPASTRGLSRTSSVTTSNSTSTVVPPKKLTPGRRGEKRKRPLKQQMEEDEDRRRRSGKIAAEGGVSAVGGALASAATSSSGSSRATINNNHRTQDGQEPTEVPDIISVDDEDIFGNVNRIEDTGATNLGPAKPRSAKASECETKNKASIKKRLLAGMEARHCGRGHAEFKDVFSVANKGVSFALRHKIATETLDKDLIGRVVKAHLDLYLCTDQEIITIDHDSSTLTEKQSPYPISPNPGGHSTSDVVSIDNHDDPNTTIL